MYNPEFDWTASINTQDNKVAEVIDKLRHVRQVSTTRPSANNTRRSGSYDIIIMFVFGTTILCIVKRKLG